MGELAFPFFPLSSTHPLLPAESFLDEIFVPRCGLIQKRRSFVNKVTCQDARRSNRFQ